MLDQKRTLFGVACAVVFAGATTACIDNDPAGAGPRIQRSSAVQSTDSIAEDPPMLAIARELESFGGFYFDDQDRIVVALTNPTDLARAEALILPRLGAHKPTGFVARAVNHSFLELARHRTRLRQHVFRIPGVVSLSVKESENLVHVGVTTNSAELAVQSVRQQLGIPGNAVRINRMPEPRHSSHSLTDTYSANQVQGGENRHDERLHGWISRFKVVEWSV